VKKVTDAHECAPTRLRVTQIPLGNLDREAGDVATIASSAGKHAYGVSPR
jgi:hypothetical protein